MDKVEFAMAHEITSKDIKLTRNKLELTQEGFAKLVNVSKKTIERWESSDKPITGPIVTLVKILNEYPQTVSNLQIPESAYSMRLYYMLGEEICTIIDVDERHRFVKIQNYTSDYMKKAFGNNEKPTYEDYEEFLESRCFPRTRDKMKIMLKELNLPFYEPIMIIEKTNGRMAEDNFWIKIERWQDGKAVKG
jgi:putative transcriptional regulator